MKNSHEIERELHSDPTDKRWQRAGVLGTWVNTIVRLLEPLLLHR